MKYGVIFYVYDKTKRVFFYGHQYLIKKKSLNIYRLGVWICFLFYKFCVFTFLPNKFYFFALYAQFSGGFWALAFNIFQKFQWIIKALSAKTKLVKSILTK